MLRFHLLLLAFIFVMAGLTEVAAQEAVSAEPGTAITATPSADGEIIATLEGDERLLILEAAGDWTQVQTWLRREHGFLTKTEGWIPSERLASEVAELPQATLPTEPMEVAELAVIEQEIVYPLLAVSVTGTPALKFSGTCQVVTPDGAYINQRFSGFVPNSFEFDARAVSCQLEKDDFRGKLRAVLTKGDQIVAWAETLNPFNWVRVRSSGPWGAPQGIEGDKWVLLNKSPRKRKRIQPQNPIVPPSRRTVVPPLSGTIVPPLGGN